MRQIFVNEIVEGERITHGYAAYEETIVQNLRTIFSQQELGEMIEGIESLSQDSGTRLVRFCQFIIYLSFHKKPKLTLGMVFIDCHSDVDAALDEYLTYGRHNWDQEAKDRFMRLFQEIQNDPGIERAVMSLWVDQPPS
jgi:hypothetical protein